MADLSPLAALDDVSATPDNKFRELLQMVVPKAICEDGAHAQDAGAELVLVPVVPVHVRMPRVVALAPEMSWQLPCGDRLVTIKLDGLSHASTRRRAYSKCPWDHGFCFKYAKLMSFAEPCMAIASILCYMRVGAFAEDKREHRQCSAATEADMATVFDEMPAALFVPEMLLSLDG
jgi:hypothetical protein